MFNFISDDIFNQLLASATACRTDCRAQLELDSFCSSCTFVR